MDRSYQGMIEIEFPVVALSEKFDSKLLSSKVSLDWSDDKHGREVWETQTNSPYRLATNKEALEKRMVMCPIAGRALPEVVMFTAKQWAVMMKYPEVTFRHEETDRLFCAASISVSRFLHNIRNNYVVKGNTLNDGSIDHQRSLERQKRLFAYPELQVILAEEEPSWDKTRLAMRFVIVKNKLRGTADETKTISWEVCHRNILTNLGVCLPDAVLRSMVAWPILLQARDLEVDQTIERYKDFLSLFSDQRSILVPTIGIELVLRTHLLSPQSYRAYTFGILGRHLAHDDTQSVEDIPYYLEETRKLWTTKYSKHGRYDEPISALSKLKGKFGKKKADQNSSLQVYKGPLSSYDLSHESMLPARATDAELRLYQEFITRTGLSSPIAGTSPTADDAMLYSQISFGEAIGFASKAGYKLNLLERGKVRPHGMHVSHNANGQGLTVGIGGGAI